MSELEAIGGTMMLLTSRKVHVLLLALGTAALLQTGCGHVRLLQRACNGGDAKSCDSLAQMYDKGKGVEKDVGKAVQLYQMACDGGDLGGCSHLGVM